MAESHVLIIGAGITGLLLAQSLKKHNIPFTIFERDPDPECRGTGWGLALHWALDTFLSLLPEQLVGRMPETYVDPVAAARGEKGKFPFFDLSTGERRWENVSPNRVRVSREKLRQLLMDGIEVQWNRTVLGVTRSSADRLVVHFEDGTSASGTHLVGCDGSRSRVRETLCRLRGSRWQNNGLPVRFLGASVVYPAEMGRKIREQCDPLFFQGGDPKTNAFMFCSVQDTPESNERESQDTYTYQVIVSWPLRAGSLDSDEVTEVPASNEERIRLVKQITADWKAPFRDLVHGIPDSVPIKSIRLEDWLPYADTWETYDGRASLIGDAAHAMTMYRGEAANHGITDVARWMYFHLASLQNPSAVGKKAACQAYEAEMIERTHLAVLASRQACLDAHDYARINDDSPLISKRAIVAKLIPNGVAK